MVILEGVKICMGRMSSLVSVGIIQSTWSKKVEERQPWVNLSEDAHLLLPLEGDTTRLWALRIIT